MRVAADLLAGIGNTPLVDVSVLSPVPGVRILAKLESQNPTGSIKDRTALAMIDDAQARGVIAPGDLLLEPTSGNTGLSLAMISRLRGYRLRVVMPDNVAGERMQLLRALGAEIITSPGALGSNGSVALARRLEQDPDTAAVMLFQYANPANPRAHRDGTAAEIIAQCPEIDAFVAGLGTGGTLMGCSERLKAHNPGIQVIACEPMPGDPVSGLRSLEDGFIPPILDLDRLDRRVLVENRDALVMMRRLLAECAIFAGPSSGAVFHTCARVAAQMERGAIVGIICDSGWRYLSSGIWTDDLDHAAATLETGAFW